MLFDLAMALPGLFIIALLALMTFAPDFWGAIVAAVLILVSGQLVSRILLNIQVSRKQWFCSLTTGLGLLGFFWIIFKLGRSPLDRHTCVSRSLIHISLTLDRCCH